MNINVRVISAQARAQIKALQQQVGLLEAELAKAGKASAGSLMGGMARNRKSMAAWGNQIQWTGRQLTYNWTLPLAIAGGAATKFALDNEKAFTHVKKVYGDTTDAAAQFNKEAGKSSDALYGQRKAAQVFNNELQALDKSFVALSNRYGVAQKDVMETAGAWAAAGQSGVALARSTQLSIQAAVLGDMSLAKATDSLISIQAQYGESTKQLRLTLAELNAIENQTGISMAGLIDGFSRTAGVARESGIDVRHLGAMLAALVPATGSAATAGNALKTIISRIMSPTKDAADVMQAFGVDTSKAFWQSSTAMDRLMVLAGHMNGTLSKAADGGYKLSDSQKQVVASVLGSRYQMNRFLVLMRELGPEYSYYEKALNATSDRTKVFQQATQELNAVLNSNPQKLKIMWTTLQNGLATAIQPMIPYIIYLAGQIAKLVTAFTNLDPSLQKLILGFLVMLALVGPIVKYFGSLMTLIGTMAMPIKMLAREWVALMTVQTEVNGVMVATRLTLFGLMTTMIKLPFELVYKGFLRIGAGIAAIPRIFMAAVAGTTAAARALVIIWQGAWAAIKAAWVMGMLGLRILSAGWAVWEMGLFTKLKTGLTILSVATWKSLVAIWGAGMKSIALMMTTGLGRIAGFVARFGKFLVSPWGIALLAILGLLAMFHDQIVQIWNNTLNYFSDSNNKMIQTVESAWYSLPGVVTNSLVAVAKVVQQAALAIYHWFSYINPFAHHSPSLVDNVTAGTAIIAAKFHSMSKSVSGDISSAYSQIKAFKNATKNLTGGANSFQEAQQRAKIKKFAPGALAEFDALSKRLKSLTRDLNAYQAKMDHQQAVVDHWQKAVDRANAALDRQQTKLEHLQAVQDKWADKLQGAQDRLDKFANAPIQGMKAMNDQIFANDMAQKQLQLDMMKMEDVTGPLEDIKSKMDAISGAQELLRGEKGDLRNAGAGSDILKSYDDQIKALDDQKVAQNGAAQALQNMSDQLDALSRKGQELDLENSLQFDPLTKQIQDAANAMQELPFDQIMAGVQGAQADIALYSQKLDIATAAVAAQQAVVDNLTAARDRLQARLDLENATLEKIKKRYDDINQAIQDVTQAMSDASSAADTLQQKQDAVKDAKKKKKGTKGGADQLSPALQNFQNAAGGNFPHGGGDGIPIRTDWSDQTAQIDKFTQRISDQAAKAFDDLNPFDAIKKKWPAFKSWLLGVFSNAGAAVGDMFSHIFKGVGGGNLGDAADKFRIAWATTVDWFKNNVVKPLKAIWRLLWPSIHEFLTNMMHGFHEMWKQIQPELEKWAPLFKELGAAFKGFWRIAKPILTIVVVQVLEFIKVVLSIAAKAIYPLLQMIGNILENVLQFVRGVLQVIIGFFTIFSGDWKKGLKEMWDGVTNILSGFFGAIGQLIKGGIKVALAIVWGFIKGIWDFFKWLYDEIVGHSIVPDMIDGIVNAFKLLADLAQWVWDNVLKPIWDVFVKVWNVVKAALGLWWDGIKLVWAGLKGAATWIWDNVLKPIWDKVVSIWKNWIEPAFKLWWEALKTDWALLAGAATWIWDNVLKPIWDKVVSIWDDWISPAFQAWWEALKTDWKLLKDAATWVWDNVLKPIFDKVKEIWDKWIEPAFQAWWEALKTDWKLLKNAATWIWDNVLDPILQKIKDLWKDHVKPNLEGWLAAIKTAWNGLLTVGTWFWNNVLKPVIDNVKSLWTNHVKPNLEGWLAAVKAAWNGLLNLGTWFWNNVLQPVLAFVKSLWTDHVKVQLDGWYAAIKTAWDNLTNLGTWFKNNVMDPVFTAVKNGWNDIKTWLTNNKDMLTAPMKTMANTIIDAVNAVIKGLNKISDILPGPINWSIGTIERLETGGRVATRGFKTNGARAIVGEGKANYPEFVIPTDPTYRNRAKGLMVQAMAKMGMKNGVSNLGVVGDTPKDMANVAAGHPGDIPAFGIGGWISSNFDGATNWFKDKAKDLIAAAANPVLDAAQNKVMGVGWDAIKPPPLFGIGKMHDWLNDVNTQYNSANDDAQDVLSGGPKVRKALAFARRQVGDPYVWGGVGPNGFDCSGFQSAITNVLRGAAPYSRVGATNSFPWGGFQNGIGPDKGYTVGSTKNYGGSGIGHMAGTLGGVNVESRGGTGVIVGPGARGYDDGGFNIHAYLPLKEGGIALRNRGPVLAAMGDGRYDEAVVPLPKGYRDMLIGDSGGNRTINFTGDLSFPNITDPADAEAFIKNLEILAETA